MTPLVSFAVFKVFFLAALAFAVAMALAPVLIRTLVRYRMGKNIRDAKDAPVMAALHLVKQGTPTAGGILVWGAVLLVLGFGEVLNFVFGPYTYSGRLAFLDRGETLLPLVALVAAAAVGLVDDYWNARSVGGGKGGGIRMRHRLALYTAIAAVGALWFYFRLDWDLLRVPFLGGYNVGWWYVPFFILVVVATSFSVNEADGLDGLAGGALLASFASMGAASFFLGKYDLATLCGVIAGALAAFLWHNVNPARFFMGDTGAMGLGVTLGVIAMLTNTALFLPVIGLVFVIESGSVLLQVASKRLRGGKKIFLSSPVHHHLEAIGWKEPQIVMRAWLVSGMTAVLGLALVLVDLGMKK